MAYLLLFFKSVLIGIANIIPGVSGGTMAVTMNVYEPLLEAFSSIRKKPAASLSYLAAAGLGAGAGILAFSRICAFLLEQYPMQTFYFFIGLIIGSLPLVYQKAVSKGFRMVYLIPFAIAFFVVTGMGAFGGLAADGIHEEVNMQMIFLLFAAGALAASAMIVPGVSGSFIMMLMGLYPTILNALNHFHIMILLPFAFGAAVGLIFIVKLITFMLHKKFGITYFTILGLVLGSIVTLVMAKETYAYGINWIRICISFITFAAGFTASTLLGGKERSEKNTQMEKV